jgi:hypothetical protein
VHRPRENQARIFSSSRNPQEGFRDRFPAYGGRLQPYLVRVPNAGPASRTRGLTWFLHGRGGSYTEPAVFHDKLLSQFGDERQNVVVSPLGRGAGGWYMDEAEFDFFEVWRDVSGISRSTRTASRSPGTRWAATGRTGSAPSIRTCSVGRSR